MKENDKFALAPRLSSAVEKVAPGAKRIMAGMVADTLDFINEVRQSRFDLFILLLNPGIYSRKDNIERPLLRKPNWDDHGDEINAYELIASLKREFDIPVIVISNEVTYSSSAKLERAGADAILGMPFGLDEFRSALQRCLMIPLPAVGENSPTRSPRIVVVDDEDGCLEMFKRLIRDRFKDVTLLLFSNSNEAWQELARTDPDLLITRDKMPNLTGEDIVRRLMDRKITYPIIVDGGWPPTEQWVRELANRGLNVSFLLSPFAVEKFLKAVETALKIPRAKIEKSAETASQSSNKRAPRIVVVDDDDNWLKLVEAMIQDWFKDAETVTFNSAQAALRESEQCDPDLLITGDKMPRMTGEELVRRLLAKNVNYPILVLTGHDEAQQWVRKYASRGFNVGFQPKRGVEHELKRGIEEILNYRRGTIEKPVETTPQPRNERALRIVVLDDVEGPRRAYAVMLKGWYHRVEMLEFEDAHDAWQELLRTDPDLFISDKGCAMKRNKSKKRNDTKNVAVKPCQPTPEQKRLNAEWERLTRFQKYYDKIGEIQKTDLEQQFHAVINFIHDLMAEEEWFFENTPYPFQFHRSRIVLLAGLTTRYLRQLALSNNHNAIDALADITVEMTETLTELLTSESQAAKENAKLIAAINSVKGVSKRVVESNAEIMQRVAHDIPYWPMLRFLNTAANSKKQFQRIAQELKLGSDCPINVSEKSNKLFCLEVFKAFPTSSLAYSP
jgi:DNA-binding NtrC family response regulator